MDAHELSFRDGHGSSTSTVKDESASEEKTLNLPGDSSFASVFGPSESVEDVGTEPESTQDKPHSFNTQKPIREKLAGKNVAPFLAKHIPEQYAPLGSQTGQLVEISSANSKYCYRHRPDLKCRRQADEPTMDKLQRVSFFFQHPSAPSLASVLVLALTDCKGIRNATTE
jgi:F-box/WD-40 domain protein MET30